MTDLTSLGQHLIATAIYTLMGLLIFALAFFLMEKLTPFSVRKEIEEDHNVALAIIMASIVIGIAMIVCASMVG